MILGFLATASSAKIARVREVMSESFMVNGSWMRFGLVEVGRQVRDGPVRVGVLIWRGIVRTVLQRRVDSVSLY